MIACSKWFQCGGGLTKLKFTRVKHLLVSAGLIDDGSLNIDWLYLVFTIAYQDLCCVTLASRKLSRETETKIVTDTAFHKERQIQVLCNGQFFIISVTFAPRNW